MKKHNLDNDTPLVPELIADLVTHDPERHAYLCERARRHYREREGFRKSLRSRNVDSRDMLHAWLDHWNKAQDKLKTRSSHAPATP